MLNKKFKTIGWRFVCVLVALVAFSQVAFAGLSGGEKFYLYLPNWAKDANAGISVTVDGVNATFTDGPSVGQNSDSGNWYYRCELTAPQNGGSTIMVYRYGPNNEGNWNLWKFSGINNEKIFDGTNASNGTDESSAETNCAKYEMNFYICGTPNNNDWDNYSAMTSSNGVSSIEYTATDSNVCYFAFKTGDNNGRNLKFRPTDTSSNKMITVGGGGVDLSVSTQSATSFGFNTEANKTYVISIDHNTFEVSVVEKVTTVYLIGSIFNDNWDSTGVKMSLNENGIYTYSFSGISSDKWFRINVNGAEYGPATNDLVVNTDGTEYEYNGNVGSNSWKLSSLDSSKTYTVNVNTGTQKISVTEEGGDEDVVDSTWSKVEILGGIYNNNFEKGNGYELSVAENGTYVYEFTYENKYNNPWFLYYVTLSDGTGYYLSPASDTDKYISSAVTYCDATTSAESFNYEFEEGEKYTITLTPSASDKTSGTIAVEKVASETPTSGVLIVGNEQSGWNLSDGEAMTFDSTTGLYSYTIKKNSEKEWFSFFIDGVQYASTTGDMTVALDKKYDLTEDANNKQGRYNFTTEEGYIYTIYVNLTEKNFYVNRVKDPNAIVGIPVYPNGVSSEAELKAYDFEANPVYYLCSPVLNDNRISPEWQMTKGSDGKYHLDGFAMRPTTAALDNYDSEEATAYVASYAAWDQSEATKYSEAVIKTNEHKDADTWTPHYEGRLYNAIFDPETQTLEFELVEDEMPFISMVGYNFRQKENYETPRDSETNHGWQEAWILYDANGKIVKDRAGKVLYNTMWPPKNQIFFNAVRGSENIELTSKNLTFTTDYVEMTGKEWKEQLQATSSQYNTLNLVDDKEYRRYVIENMWILGATKIWTGWGGQTVYDGNGNANSQWSNHINWGYLDVDTNDGGSTITANTTVDVVVDDKNFLFAKPTYFRTVEFFYCVDDKTNGSKFFTTLSHGDASIQAKATTDYEGSYKLAANNVPEGATITAYKVTRYEAATGTAIGVVADVKEQSLTQDAFNAIGWTDDTVLSNGKYYYVAEITFTDANGDVSTETVVSNPFTIYNATYENEVEAHQLLELTADGKAALNNTPATYITYNPAGFGALYLVNEDGSVATELTDGALTDAWSVLADDANYDWSTNVWLHSDVPADYAEAAENNAETGISLDNITNYNLFINGVESDKTPQTTDKSFSCVYDAEKIGQTNLYGLTMDYTQVISGENVSKVSAGGNANLTLVAPQAKRATENEVTFGVEKVSAETTTAVKNVEGEATITDYYILNATFNFVAPNIDSDIEVAYDVVYVPTVKITNADGTVTTKVLDPIAVTSVTVSDLDPTATNIEFTVETRYYPQGTTYYENTPYAVGTYGDGVTIKSEMPTLGSEAAPTVEATVGISANADDNSKYDITVSNATATLEANSFAGEALENVYYDFDVNNEDGDQVAGLQNGQVDENGVGDNLGTVMTGVDKPESVTVAATPVYVFKVGDEFVGLRGTTGTDLVEEGSYTGVESTFAGSVSVATGNGYIEVLGASEVNVYDIAGTLIGGGDTRFEVVSGVYVVVANGKAMKVIVR